jgi:hypothetical protein
VFDFIEMFYNPVRKYLRSVMLPHVELERQAMKQQGSGELGAVQ